MAGLEPGMQGGLAQRNPPFARGEEAGYAFG